MKIKDIVLSWCVSSLEIPLILKECHDSMVGGYFVADVMLERYYKVVIGGLPIFSKCITYRRQCDGCQRIGKPTNSSVMPLKTILALARFEK